MMKIRNRLLNLTLCCLMCSGFGLIGCGSGTGDGAGCQNICDQLGAERCTDTTTIQECQEVSNGCNDWVNVAECGAAGPGGPIPVECIIINGEADCVPL